MTERGNNFVTKRNYHSKDKRIMKATEQFKRTIGEYLQVRANTDETFAKSFAKEGKTLDGCVTFILNTVKESGCNGFDDEEIYGMAVHYYDEDEIDPKYMKNVGGNVVVNHQIKLTDEEKRELEQKAKDAYYDECMRKQREQNKPKAKPAQQSDNQLSLF